MQSSDSSSGTDCVLLAWPVLGLISLDQEWVGLRESMRELMGYACPHFGKSVSCRSVSSLLVCSRCRGLMAFSAGGSGADVFLRAVTQHSLDGAGDQRRRGLDHGATQGPCQGCRRPFRAVWRRTQDTCTFRGVAHATRPAFLGLEALHVPRTQALDRARVASVGDVASRHGLHSIRFPRAGGSGSRVPLRLLLANA